MLLALCPLLGFAQEPENDQEQRITALEEQSETLDKLVKGLSKFKASAYIQGQYQYGEEDASLKVSDKNGNIVYTEQLTNQKAGVMQFQWDGKNNDGVAQADGTYSINVSAKANGEAVSATPLAYSKVEALSWNNGVPVLHLSNGKEVGVDALRQLI